MELKINDYEEPEHFRAICENNYDVSRTCEYVKNEMHHIHNSCEILLVEDGEADYYISGKKYHLEPRDIMVIGPMEHHFRRIDRLPFLRYGLTIRPNYFRSIILDHDLLKVFLTPKPEDFTGNYKRIPPDIFQQIVDMLCYLKAEEGVHRPFRSQVQRTVIIQIAVLLFRTLGFKRSQGTITPSNIRMLEIKEYIDVHFREELNLNILSQQFFLHPATISKEFSRNCGYNLNKYINTVRVCEAASLLENNDDSVALIAEKCGYDSVNTFLRQFKSIMDVSPLQYRKSVHKWRESSRKNREK